MFPPRENKFSRPNKIHFAFTLNTQKKEKKNKQTNKRYTIFFAKSVKMSNHQEDLSLLLSLQDKFLETPPGSPSNPGSSSPGNTKRCVLCVSRFLLDTLISKWIEFKFSTLVLETSIWVSLSLLDFRVFDSSTIAPGFYMDVDSSLCIIDIFIFLRDWSDIR